MWCEMGAGHLRKYMVENLFGIEGWNIAWYGVVIGVGILMGVALASYRARREGMDGGMVYDFILMALPFSVVCARIYYVIFEWNSYAGSPAKVFAVWEGGLAIYGGVLGGLLAAALFCRGRHIPLMRFLDLVIPSLVLGQAVGRWGNFVNQEAFGNIVTDPGKQHFPYSVFIEKMGEWRQATFFYESVWNLCLLAVMLVVSRKPMKRGSLLCLYFIGYGTGRFLIEGLRADSLYLFQTLRVSQLLSLVLAAIGIVLWLSKVRKESPGESL